jgi:hypothetical protein
MSNVAAITEKFFRCLENGRVETEPFRHWLLEDVLPPDLGNAITALPFDPPRIGDTKGKRETHNESRIFFSVENQGRFDVCRDLAGVFQNDATVRKLDRTCGTDLGGSFLRIEYCQDMDGFWLEPHTDISVKLFTMLIYLSTDPGSENWGTDIYDEDMNFVGTSPSAFNRGLIFIPGANTWHGFRKRPIDGVRKLIIVNYVKDEWRARHELAYPDQPVG